MRTTLPSDRLARPRHPWRTAAIVAGAVVATGGTYAVADQVLNPPAVRTVGAVRLVGGEGKPTLPQISHKLLTPHQAKATTPPPTPEPVYVAPPQGQSYSYGNYPSGWTVPFIPGTDAPDTSACASSSASTVGGVAVCD